MNSTINEEKSKLVDEYNELYKKTEKTYKGSYPSEIVILMFIAKALTILVKEN